MNDLPALLSLGGSSRVAADQTSENGSESSSSQTTTASSTKQTFSLAMDPTALDPGTIPISPSIFDVSANQPEAVTAVVMGGVFTDNFDKIIDYCGKKAEKVAWFQADFEKIKKLGLSETAMSEALGRRVKEALNDWEKECRVAEWEVPRGVKGVRYF